MALLLAVYRANSQEVKRDEISKAREHIEEVKLLVRLLHDLKQLSLKQVVKITLLNDSISKQLAAWFKSVNKINK